MPQIGKVNTPKPEPEPEIELDPKPKPKPKAKPKVENVANEAVDESNDTNILLETTE